MGRKLPGYDLNRSPTRWRAEQGAGSVHGRKTEPLSSSGSGMKAARKSGSVLPKGTPFTEHRHKETPRAMSRNVLQRTDNAVPTHDARKACTRHAAPRLPRRLGVPPLTPAPVRDHHVLSHSFLPRLSSHEPPSTGRRCCRSAAWASIVTTPVATRDLTARTGRSGNRAGRVLARVRRPLVCAVRRPLRQQGGRAGVAFRTSRSGLPY